MTPKNFNGKLIDFSSYRYPIRFQLILVKFEMTHKIVEISRYFQIKTLIKE